MDAIQASAEAKDNAMQWVVNMSNFMLDGEKGNEISFFLFTLETDLGLSAQLRKTAMVTNKIF